MLNKQNKELKMELSNKEWKEKLDNLLFEKWSYETAGGDNYDALHPEYDSKDAPWFSQKHNDRLKQSYKQAKYDYQEIKSNIKYVREQIKEREILCTD